MKNQRLHFKELTENSYPGRGIVLGINSKGTHTVQVYWIMGRSDSSRNRVFRAQDGKLFTDAADITKMKNSHLLIYCAMAEHNGNYIVSNGDQTDNVIESLKSETEATLREALCHRKYEPDSPNFTPRITGVTRVSNGKAQHELSILRKRPAVLRGDECERSYYEYDDVHPGIGFCVTTYLRDDNPLPTFEGGPYPVPLDGDGYEILCQYWEALDKENRVAIAVKLIDLNTGESVLLVENEYKMVRS